MHRPPNCLRVMSSLGYLPDVKSPLYDRVARNQAQALDRYEFDYIYLGVTGVPLCCELPGELLQYATIWIESSGFCYYYMGLKR